MGTALAQGEGGAGTDGAPPRREVEVEAFALEGTAVTVQQFGAFVDATSYVTDSERFGWGFVPEFLADEETVASECDWSYLPVCAGRVCVCVCLLTRWTTCFLSAVSSHSPSSSFRRGFA